MPEIDVQAIWSQMMGQDIAICGLLETLARVQPAIAKAVAEDIRSKADQLQNSRTPAAAEANQEGALLCRDNGADYTRRESGVAKCRAQRNTSSKQYKLQSFTA